MYLTVSSWFLISFIMGGAAWAGRLSSFMHLSGRAGGLGFFMHLLPNPHSMGPETSVVGSCNWNHLCTYDLYSPGHNVLDAWISIIWASGRGLGPRNLEFFWPQLALAYRGDAISKGPKNSRFPGPNPRPLALLMDMCINSYNSQIHFVVPLMEKCQLTCWCSTHPEIQLS
jgi:hypothetical protein